MYLILWQFRAKPSTRRHFIRAYGASGAWVRLFRRSRGFVATRLLADPQDPLTFFTVDIWRSRKAHVAARHLLRHEYLALDAACEKLTRSELRIGAFSMDG